MTDSEPNPARAKPNARNSRESATARRRISLRPDQPGWRRDLYDIIFEADTPAGRYFDIGLLIAILASIAIVSLETVPSYAHTSLLGIPLLQLLEVGEWLLTALFTVEYVLRLLCVRRPLHYATSFWGIIDLLSVLPTYITLLVARDSAQAFVILRSVRLLRVFRVLKLWRMMSEADELSHAIWQSRDKIVVFLCVLLVAVTVSATLMYQIETVWQAELDPDTGLVVAESEFTSIPQAMYWAIVTMTTVGYGDVVPHTTLGKVISAALILLGYSLIIVPTGFVSAELASRRRQSAPERHPCPECAVTDHRLDATYCYRCGTRLDES